MISDEELTRKILRTSAAIEGLVIDAQDPDRAGEMSRDGIRVLAQWEGIRTQAYRDSAGKLTIGIGHLLTQPELASGFIFIDGQSFDWSLGISEEQCHILLAQDLDIFERTVDGLLSRLSLKSREFDSLVSFCFNIGTYAFLHGGNNAAPCNVARALLTGRREDVAPSFLKWNKVTKGGAKVVEDGLTNRRAKEIEWGGWNNPQGDART